MIRINNLNKFKLIKVLIKLILQIEVKTITIRGISKLI